MEGRVVPLILIVTIFEVVCGGTDWKQMARDSLDDILKMRVNENRAKNVILFIGDGMSVTTVTAARIYKGQKMNKTGEETVLAFEKFGNVALSKVYSTDRQIPDSASTATALMCGVKTNDGVLGLTDSVISKNCSSASGNEVHSILDHFNADGRATGIVTTARITHATPAAAYAHSVTRDWEGYNDIINVPGGCKDIAYQLVYDNYDIQVAMGGGRRHFLPDTKRDPETNTTNTDHRKDGSDLTEIWKTIQRSRGRNHEYVWNKGQFDAIDPADTDYVLGLFHPGHMQYELDRDTSDLGEPSFKEMTSKAIKILQKNKKGFFLMAEGGRIDHAHHESRAKKALEETLQFEEAIIEAQSLTNEEDTLIIVTADHPHVFTMGGYTVRGNDILGLVNTSSMPLDDKPYTTLAYANGPGWSAVRENLTNVDTRDKNYVQQSAVPRSSETHGGDDVAIYATGPMSHLIRGVQEQHYVAYVMQFASCLGDYNNCARPSHETDDCISACSKPSFPFFAIFIGVMVFRLFPH